MHNKRRMANYPTKTKILLVVSGVLIGAVNGFFGGGGGLICVPVLGGITGLSAKEAHATAILVILPLSVVSAAVYAFSGSWKWASGLPVAAGVVAGGILGALLLKKLSNKVVSIIFAAVMIFAGARMIF